MSFKLRKILKKRNSQHKMIHLLFLLTLNYHIMNFKKYVLIALLTIGIQSIYAQSKIVVTANFMDAEFFQMSGNTVLKPAIGKGSIQLKLDKEGVNRIGIFKEGFEPLIQEFPRTRKWPKEVQVFLEIRIVEINAEPFDAKIFVNGNFVGNKTYKLLLQKGTIATVEIKKEGFATKVKTYYNKDDMDVPPITELIRLENRLVRVNVDPADAEIVVNEKNEGKGSKDVVISQGECVVIRAIKNGYVYEEKIFCNKENDQTPPFEYQFVLEDRLVTIVTSPDDAEIKVDGKVLGRGDYDLKISKNQCVEVTIIKDGYVALKQNYCNQDDYQKLPIRDHLELKEDEAFKTSVSTDIANVNITIPVNSKMDQLEAWKLISSIVTTEFDVLEVIDRETGYLRTAWQVQSFNGESTIRTRVIVKLGDSSPLKYVIKISSERADGVVSVKDDQEFEQWHRILKKYQYIIEEVQARLR